jgi:hypothetical protein
MSSTLKADQRPLCRPNKERKTARKPTRRRRRASQFHPVSANTTWWPIFLSRFSVRCTFVGHHHRLRPPRTTRDVWGRAHCKARRASLHKKRWTEASPGKSLASSTSLFWRNGSETAGFPKGSVYGTAYTNTRRTCAPRSCASAHAFRRACLVPSSVV